MLLPTIFHQQCVNEGQYFNNKYTSVPTASFVNKLVQYNPKTLLIICNYMSYHLKLAKKT